MSFTKAFFATALVATAQACVSGTCSSSMCSDIPSTNQYYLTSFCDSTVACGSFSGNCNEYFAADYKRFGCNSIISCCQGTNCVNLKVIDGGPNCTVEDSAHKQVVDASPSTCKHFTGSTSCGWSDKIVVTCKKTSSTIHHTNDPQSIIYSATNPVAKVPLGPCSYDHGYAAENGVPICGPDFNLFTADDLLIQ